MKAYKQSPAEKWVESLGIANNEMRLESELWSLGGTTGRYWGEVTVEADTPLYFHQLDDLLFQTGIYIPDQIYSEIFNECSYIEEIEIRDYYGGFSRSNRHCCDLNKLYNFLLENNLIKG